VVTRQARAFRPFGRKALCFLGVYYLAHKATWITGFRLFEKTLIFWEVIKVVIVMSISSATEQIDAVNRRLSELGFHGHMIRGAKRRGGPCLTN